MEDSGYAFEYIKYLMKQKFKTLRIEMAQFHGYKGIKKTTKELTDYTCKNNKHFELIIAIYDSGNKVFYDQDKFNDHLYKFVRESKNTFFLISRVYGLAGSSMLGANMLKYDGKTYRLVNRIRDLNEYLDMYMKYGY